MEGINHFNHPEPLSNGTIALIAVGVLLVVITIVITREVKTMITGESAAPEKHAAINAHSEARPEVEHVTHLSTL